MFEVSGNRANPLPTEYILGGGNVESLFTPMPPLCVGASGHGELELSSDDSEQFGGPNIELQDRLREFRGDPGTHQFTVGEVSGLKLLRKPFSLTGGDLNSSVTLQNGG